MKGSNNTEETQKPSKLNGKTITNLNINQKSLDKLFTDYFNIYAKSILWITISYCIIAAIIIILSGWNCIHFKLSNNVLLMLLGTTTTNIIGLMAIVAKFLFSDKNLAIILNHEKNP
jgi:hypothetical protein